MLFEALLRDYMKFDNGRMYAAYNLFTIKNVEGIIQMDIGMLEKAWEKYDGYMLMKFTSSYEFQQDFLDGKLFFNTSDFFARCDKEGQGDPDEGNTFIISPSNPGLISANLEELNGKMAIVVRDYSDNPEGYKSGTVWNLSTSENRYRKIICLYTAYVNVAKNEVAPFPQKMGEEFGEYGILILNRQQFFSRVCDAISKANNLKKAQMGFVEYWEANKIQGLIDWNPFF